MRRLFLTALVIPLILGCSGTESPEPVNQAPSITFITTEIVFDFLRSNTLAVSVSDPDGDPLSVTWEITSGTLVPAGSQTMMEWTPVRSVGDDIVTITVSDGELSDSVTEPLKRGTHMRQDEYNTETFDFDRSPFIIDPVEETIGFGAIGYGTITIDPGVELYINKRNLAIEVLGTLQSNGTQQDTILIRPNDRTLRCADQRDWWEGFRVISDENNDGQVNMTWTQVSYGVKNLSFQNGSIGNLTNCRFVCSSEAGVLMSSVGTLVVDNCDVSSNRSHGVDVTSSLIPTSVTITNNLIKSNGHTGINLNLQDIERTLTTVITGNSIQFNSVHGIALTNSAWATIQNNDFILNNLSSISNIWLDTPYPGAVFIPSDWDTLLATSNYWSRAYDPGQASFIEDTVRDKSDNPTLGTYVIIAPWENEKQSSH